MRWPALLLLSACGRVGFTATGDGALGGDGGGDDAGDAADSGSDGPAFSCAGFDVCDDFEGPIDPTWLVDPGVSLDTTITHRGGQSARMHMTALAVGQQGAARIWESVTLSPVPAETWIRAWMRMSAIPDGTNRLEMISIERNGGGGAADYVFVHSGLVEVYVEPQGAVMPSSGSVATDSWFCLVFHVVFSTTANGSLDVSGDFAAGINGTITNNGSMPVDMIGVGPYFSGTNVLVAQPAFDVWVDDVIVHGSPVTCAD
jgi:hypothetical protein